MDFTESTSSRTAHGTRPVRGTSRTGSLDRRRKCRGSVCQSGTDDHAPTGRGRCEGSHTKEQITVFSKGIGLTLREVMGGRARRDEGHLHPLPLPLYCQLEKRDCEARSLLWRSYSGEATQGPNPCGGAQSLRGPGLGHPLQPKVPGRQASPSSRLGELTSRQKGRSSLSSSLTSLGLWLLSATVPLGCLYHAGNGQENCPSTLRCALLFSFPARPRSSIPLRGENYILTGDMINFLF